MMVGPAKVALPGFAQSAWNLNMCNMPFASLNVPVLVTEPPSLTATVALLAEMVGGEIATSTASLPSPPV